MPEISHKGLVCDVVTAGELRAAALLYGPYRRIDTHQAANELIALAEQIKAERAVVAMQKGV